MASMPVPRRAVSLHPALGQGQAHGHTTDAGGTSALGTLGGRGRTGRTAVPARRLRDRLARSPLHPRGGEEPDRGHAERALLATARGAPSHRPVPRSRGYRELRGRAPVVRRLCALDSDRPAHARRRVSLRRDTATHLGGPGRLGAGDGPAPRRAGRHSAGAGAKMAPGGAGLLPSAMRRAPQLGLKSPALATERHQLLIPAGIALDPEESLFEAPAFQARFARRSREPRSTGTRRSRKTSTSSRRSGATGSAATVARAPSRTLPTLRSGATSPGPARARTWCRMSLSRPRSAA